MPRELYSAGSAAVTGLASQWVLQKAQKVGVPMFDLIFAGAAAAVAYMVGTTARADAKAIADGVLNGAAAYIGTRVPALLAGTAARRAPATYYMPAALPSAPQPAPIPSLLEL